MIVPRLPSAAVTAMAALIASCAPASVCHPDASAALYRIEVEDGACATRTLAIPTRETLACDGLDDEIGGVRVELAGRPGTSWTFTLQRTDGAPAAYCAGALDEACACMTAACSPTAFESVLVLELGTVDRESIDVMVGAGTYVGELCSR